MGFFDRLKDGLTRTRDQLVAGIENVVLGKKKIDDALLDEIEELMILSDLGVETTSRIISSVQEKVRRNELDDASLLKKEIKEQIRAILARDSAPLRYGTSLAVYLVIGVNGVGKTTTIGKMASMLKSQGRKVILGAADTFRAAAAEQLVLWGERAGTDVIRHKSGADPGAVVFDAIAAARAREQEILIIDTAGRLHTKSNLMEELKKINRVIERELPGEPREVLLVLDATTGQNALSQAKLFNQAVGVTGIVLTKLDGTAKGGIIVAIASELGIPVKMVGVGEKIEDLQPFDPNEFVEALFD
ncbi:MAG: signal recognition particle-docking protein FtsY [Nitrospirae bacterium]|nr:signal recognition particle-docking protein FtsY [Nitrospirota bacterium]